jgi:hypothetical protein
MSKNYFNFGCFFIIENIKRKLSHFQHFYNNRKTTLAKMNHLKTELYLAIKNSNYSKCVEILKKLDLKQNEFFDDKVSFITLAVLNGLMNFYIFITF